DRPRHVAQRWVAAPTQDLLLARVDRDHVVALGDHVDRREMAGTERIGREADHRDPPRILQNAQPIERGRGERRAIDGRVGVDAAGGRDSALMCWHRPSLVMSYEL